MKNLLMVMTIVTSAHVFSDAATAQLFGSQSVRRAISRQGNTNVGQIQGNERYLRGQRRQRFVGADQNEGIGFVGNEQARTSGTIASPTGGMKKFADKSNQINRPVADLRSTDPYPAVLILPESLRAKPRNQLQVETLNENLTRELKRKVNDSIEVSVEARSATLRGEVSSVKDKNLAKLLILFEPGIDVVQNEIVIANQ